MQDRSLASLREEIDKTSEALEEAKREGDALEAASPYARAVKMGRFPHPLYVERSFDSLKMRAVKPVRVKGKRLGLDEQDIDQWLWDRMQDCLAAATQRVRFFQSEANKLFHTSDDLEIDDFVIDALQEVWDDPLVFDAEKECADIKKKAPSLVPPKDQMALLTHTDIFLEACVSDCWTVVLARAYRVFQEARKWFKLKEGSEH